jgi:uncharacterized protein YcfJ
MKYYAVALLTFIVSSHAEMLNTGSNDYYMTPPASASAPSTSAPSSVQEQCWYEQVPINGTAQGDNTPNVGGAIVGGIVGGVVGHQFGSGSGNTAATVAGAAIGTALGASAGNAPSTPQYQMIKKCNTSH